MAENNLGNTQYFRTKPDQELEVKEVLDLVYNAMDEKGYNPVNQIVGYIMSGDPLGLTAQRLDTIWRKQENKLRKTLASIEALVEEYGVERIVVGYPKNMNNTVGERAEKALEFGEMLKRRTGLEVVMWDERLTTVEADRTLMEAGVRRENRKQYLDGLAAVFILQGYLDSLVMK